MAVAAMPGSPRWAVAYPQGAAYMTLFAMSAGAGGGSLAIAFSDSAGAVWIGVQILGWSILSSSLISWAWREAIMRLPGTRNFATARHRFEAQFLCRRLRESGMDWLVVEVWDNLSKASLSGYQGDFDKVYEATHRVIAATSRNDPDRQGVLDFTAHLRALDAKLREDPKQLG